MEDNNMFIYVSGKKVFVDPEDYEKVVNYNWYIDDKGYVRCCNKVLKGIRLHRFILGLDKNNKRQTDHINHDKLDNRRQNLAIVSNRENCINRHSVWGRSKYRGVSWRKDRSKWKARIRVHGKIHELGLYETEKEAALAYDIAAKKHFHHYPYLNFGNT